ncbi:MAG TPA: hypothetical protein VFR86_07300 [Burkholderiaceae bacterium]|nr:hypothetical protein [Burkholderiaceae bacterium]
MQNIYETHSPAWARPSVLAAGLCVVIAAASALAYTQRGTEASRLSEPAPAVTPAAEPVSGDKSLPGFDFRPASIDDPLDEKVTIGWVG